MLSRLSSIARCVWSGDVNLAQFFISKSDLASQHVDLSSGIPMLTKPDEFEQQFREAKSRHLEGLKSEVYSLGSNAEQKHKSKYRLRRPDNLQKLWLVLGSVTCETEIPADFRNGSTPQLRALAFFYSQVFGGGPICVSQAKKLLSVYARNVTWERELAKPMSLELVASWLSRARDSTPGWDGVPYSAWRGLGCTGPKLLHRLVVEQTRALPPPLLLTILCGTSPPKSPFPLTLPTPMLLSGPPVRPGL